MASPAKKTKTHHSTIVLSTGQVMPLLGLGTWQAPKGEVGAAVTAALACGYRHIDCAAIYGNEGEVGEALAAAFAGGLKREDVFITSKLFNSEKAPADVRPALEKTLKDLRLDYLDLYLIHWPQQFAKTEGVVNSIPRNDDQSVRYGNIPIMDTWRVLETAVDESLVKAIGVSNFNTKQINTLCDAARVQPTCNQVESHPFFAQDALVAACSARGVTLSAYSPLGSGATVDGFTVASHPTLAKIGEKHHKSAAQVAIAFQVDRGVPTFPKSVTASRIQQNFDIADIVFDDLDRALLSALDRGFEGRVGFGGPKVDRNGVMEPRDLLHADYPWNADGTERS